MAETTWLLVCLRVITDDLRSEWIRRVPPSYWYLFIEDL